MQLIYIEWTSKWIRKKVSNKWSRKFVGRAQSLQVATTVRRHAHWGQHLGDTSIGTWVRTNTSRPWVWATRYITKRIKVTMPKSWHLKIMGTSRQICSLESWLEDRHSAILRLRNKIGTQCSQSYGFSGSHVWMCELDHKEGWSLKNWCLWIMLEKTLENLLDCKEIKLVNPKGNQP